MAHSKPWQSGKPILQCIEHMLVNKVATDVTLLVDGSKVEAHKFILTSRSPVFQANFDSPVSDQGEIRIKDVSKETFDIFLRYLYTDNIELDIDNVADILKVADKYLVDILIKKCHDFIEDNLNPDNVCRMQERWHDFPNDKLVSECRRIWDESACDILNSEGFRDLCDDCAYNFISSDLIPVDEHLIFEAVIRWADAECRRQDIEITDASRRKHSGKLFSCIRFPIMDAEYFCNTVFNMSVLSNDELVEIHRHIHKRKSSDRCQSRKGQKTLKPSTVTASGVHGLFNFATALTTQPVSPGAECKQDFHFFPLSPEDGTTNNSLNHEVCAFNCNYRVAYRKGAYESVIRYKMARGMRVTNQIISTSEHFSCSSSVYLHGIMTAFKCEKINVKFNGEDMRIQREENDSNNIRFRRIVTVEPHKENVICIEVKGQTDVFKPTSIVSQLSYKEVIINFTDKNGPGNGFVTGLLLSK
ncbi:BTB/POZ domain-containing protein 2-like [Argopecten irradians]|uniref:BTB/POZ domain-containing protein 2-like n=1 Tax=Argopecten irradians TaxID=31199 RepID=UPI0037181474